MRVFGFADVGSKKKVVPKLVKKPALTAGDSSSFMDASTASDSFNRRNATDISGIVMNERQKPVSAVST